MAQFNIPSSPKIYTYEIGTFLGIDHYNQPSNVDKRRSPDAPNMMRDEVGKVRKRMGFQTLCKFPGAVNGVHGFQGKRLIHAGDKFYEAAEADETDETTETDETDETTEAEENTPDGWKIIGSGLNDQRSTAFQLKGKLYLLDGQNFWVYDGETLSTVSENAYVPTIIISRNPSGGGTTYEPLNLLGRKWKESFLGQANISSYYLTTKELDDDKVEAEILQSDGTWKTLTEGKDFTVNRKTGCVTFNRDPGASPVTGYDNVHITAAKTRSGYADKIQKCRFGVLYGVGGSADRIFVSGNPDEPNLDYYSGYNDPTMFGDTSYSQLCQDDGEVMGYSVLGGKLAAHLTGGQNGRNIIVREGTLDDSGNAVFKITNTLIGAEALGRYAFAATYKEPLFLSRNGVFAITTEELTAEKFSQKRSLYLTNSLESEEGLEDAYAMVWRDFYLLAVPKSGRVYLLDTMQREYSKNEPYSNFQYECYYWTGIYARVLWSDEEALYFGRQDGSLCRFFNDVDQMESYNDDGNPIQAYWETANIEGDLFYHNKTFRYLAVRLAAAVQTGVKIDVQKKGLWSQIFDAGAKARYLDFRQINFAKWSFSTDQTPRTLGGKIKIKKVDKVRFRLKNEELDEPFGLYGFALEFTEQGKYKG